MEHHICQIFMGRSWKWHIFLLTCTPKARTQLRALSPVSKEAGKHSLAISQAEKISGSWEYALLDNVKIFSKWYTNFYSHQHWIRVTIVSHSG